MTKNIISTMKLCFFWGMKNPSYPPILPILTKLHPWKIRKNPTKIVRSNSNSVIFFLFVRIKNNWVGLAKKCPWIKNSWKYSYFVQNSFLTRKKSKNYRVLICLWNNKKLKSLAIKVIFPIEKKTRKSEETFGATWSRP